MPRLLDQFVKDKPFPAGPPPGSDLLDNAIAGCSAIPLVRNRDGRGNLTELLTSRDAPIYAIVHVYQVVAAPLSQRGWVYHARSTDRLAFTHGRLRVHLHDLREESPTYGKSATLILGDEQPALLTIAPFVAHVVENLAETAGLFVNLPTRAWDPADPDKFRLPLDSPLLPYPFLRAAAEAPAG
jgi:dTDP-4-dehydrorhamnose 3,5-epimerase